MALPLFLGDLEEGRPLQHPGVVHQDVEAAQEAVRLGDDAFHVRLGLRGPLDCYRPPSQRLDLPDGTLGVRTAAPAAHCHVRALAGESESDAPADAAGAAGDEGALACETHGGSAVPR